MTFNRFLSIILNIDLIVPYKKNNRKEVDDVERRVISHLRKEGGRGVEDLTTKPKKTAGISQPLFELEDPLGEESHYSPVKGLVHKYKNRVLWKVSYRCAVHCQFCTRMRQIGSSDGDLKRSDIDLGMEYLRSHPEVDDVILSGGDPLYTPDQTIHILEGLMGIKTIRVVRIGTRLPVHSPQSIQTPHVGRLLECVAKMMSEKTFFFLVHINHPDELTVDVRGALRTLKRTTATLLSQTVFLKGINNDISVLETLFRELYYLGVIPYYIYRCDYVRGLERFVCDLAQERKIITELRVILSGIACPAYVVDVAGVGKLPVPLGFWKVPQIDRCHDFSGNIINLSLKEV